MVFHLTQSKIQSLYHGLQSLILPGLLLLLLSTLLLVTPSHTVAPGQLLLFFLMPWDTPPPDYTCDFLPQLIQISTKSFLTPLLWTKQLSPSQNSYVETQSPV